MTTTRARQALAEVDFDKVAEAFSSPETMDTARRMLDRLRTEPPDPPRISRKKTQPPQPIDEKPMARRKTTEKLVAG